MKAPDQKNRESAVERGMGEGGREGEVGRENRSDF